jgi:hypothetical protein
VAQCGPVADLAARGRELDHLNRQLRPRLPSNLGERITLAALRNDCAILHAPSPAWAARARMEQGRILTALRALGVAVAAIRVRVSTEPAADLHAGRSAPMSPAAARRLRAAAASMTDPELRALFLELASSADTRPAS